MTEKRSDARNRRSKKLVYAIMVLLLGVSTAIAQNKPDPLKSGFENPPEGARPRVWWHWMNGNITKEGIKLDLEWMQRVGLGGFQNFDAALGTPQVLEHAAQLTLCASRRGLGPGDRPRPGNSDAQPGPLQFALPGWNPDKLPAPLPYDIMSDTRQIII
jgi:hypothetical protein